MHRLPLAACGATARFMGAAVHIRVPTVPHLVPRGPEAGRAGPRTRTAWRERTPCKRLPQGCRKVMSYSSEKRPEISRRRRCARTTVAQPCRRPVDGPPAPSPSPQTRSVPPCRRRSVVLREPVGVEVVAELAPARVERGGAGSNAAIAPGGSPPHPRNRRQVTVLDGGREQRLPEDVELKTGGGFGCRSSERRPIAGMPSGRSPGVWTPCAA